METEKKYSSTDPRLNEVPTDTDGYGLCHFAAPSGLNIAAEREQFAEKCLAEKMPKGEAQDAWYQHGRKLVDTFEKAHGQGAAEARESAAYGRETFMSPQEAEREINRICSDPKHPYNDDRAMESDRQNAVAFMNRAHAIKMGLETNFTGYLTEHIEERRETMKNFYDNRSSSHGERTSDSNQNTHHDIGFAGKETSSAVGSRIEDAA